MGDSFERLNSSIRYLFSSSLGRRGDDDEAESEALWERLLPTDHMQILSRAVDPVEDSPKKELYFRLHQPLLLDTGSKSFVLDMATGKKCYMLSARELGIAWGSDHRYWRWINHPDSRFAEVAELVDVCWLDIHGKINTSDLSRNTTYAAYLIFRLPLQSSRGFVHQTQKASISIGTATLVESNVHLEPQEEDEQKDLPERTPRRNWRNLLRPPRPPARSQMPPFRNDGWTELCLGEFDNYGQIDGEIKMSLWEVEELNWKSGLIVEGIEVRPKKKQ